MDTGVKEMDRARWTFLTPHAFVLLSVERHPDATVRELGRMVGLTERQVHRILDDLEAAGAITRRRAGRQNLYTVHRDRLVRHSGAKHVGDLLALLAPES